MAKANSSKIKRLQSAVPEANRTQVSVSEDGEWVFFSTRYRRYETHMIRKTHPIKVDRTKVRPDRHEEAYVYGEGRKLRDGAVTETMRGVKKGGKPRKLKAKNKEDAAELLVNAIAHAEGRQEWLYGQRDGKRKSVTVDTATDMLRIRLIKFATLNLVDSNGKPFKASTLPSDLCRAATVADAVKAAKAIGVPKKNLVAMEKKARKTAADLDDDTDMSIAV